MASPVFNKGIYKAFCFTLYEPENAKTNQVMLTNRETIFKLKILIIVETVFKDNGALPSHPRFSGYAASTESKQSYDSNLMRIFTRKHT